MHDGPSQINVTDALAFFASTKMQMEERKDPWAAVALEEVIGQYLDVIKKFRSTESELARFEDLAGKEAAPHLIAIFDIFESNRHFLNRYHRSTLIGKRSALKQLYLNDPIWASIRHHATEVLDHWGFDLDEYERSNPFDPIGLWEYRAGSASVNAVVTLILVVVTGVVAINNDNPRWLTVYCVLLVLASVAVSVAVVLKFVAYRMSKINA